MAYKSTDGWSESYPYDFYVYKDKNNICPECQRTPMVYRVPVDYHNKIDVQFTCASDHKWIHKLDLKICHWCNQEGVYKDDEYYSDMTIWWCADCISEHGQDIDGTDSA